MKSNIGLSSSYYAFKKQSIYDSVKNARELGFELVELGAAHSPEKGIPETLKRISKDFGDLAFTIHGLFPPQRQKVWFNLCDNSFLARDILHKMFHTAYKMNAIHITFHPGTTSNLAFTGEEREDGFSIIESKGLIDRKKAMENMFAMIEYAFSLKEEFGINFGVENIPSKTENWLISKAEDIVPLIEKFPDLNMLLDVGHALIENELEKFVEFDRRIIQLHLHDVVEGIDHCAIGKGILDLNVLRKIQNLKKIPIIFEHGTTVSENEIAEEKKAVESFLKKSE